MIQRNSNIREKTNGVGTQVPLAWARGYQDAAMRYTYHPDYETWGKIDQGNYERGRMVATAILACGQTPPPLGQNNTITQAILTAARAAGELGHTGSALPPDPTPFSPIRYRGRLPAPIPEVSHTRLAARPHGTLELADLSL